MLKRLALCLGLVSLTSCVSLNSVSLTQVPKERKKVVEAEASRIIIFAFNFDNDYVDRVVEELKGKCPNGKVQGILTKDESVNYFLWIVHRRRVIAQGYCLDS